MKQKPKRKKERKKKSKTEGKTNSETETKVEIERKFPHTPLRFASSSSSVTICHVASG
jgi:hypothetical protein